MREKQQTFGGAPRQVTDRSASDSRRVGSGCGRANRTALISNIGMCQDNKRDSAKDGQAGNAEQNHGNDGAAHGKPPP